MSSLQGAARPLIAVTCSARAFRRLQEGGAVQLRRYLDCLERAGGQPVLVSPDQQSSPLEACSGLLLPGGVDVHPRWYGEAPDGADSPDESLDALELALIKQAQERSWPVLGICRGMQVLNVALEGSLEQDVPGHRKPAGSGHAIDLAPGSALARVLGLAGTVTVNSRHHQAVVPGKLAPGLRAAALSTSGSPVIEAVESADGAWLFGVQCHPERLDEVPPEFARLFQALVAQAAGSTSSRPKLSEV